MTLPAVLRPILLTALLLCGWAGMARGDDSALCRAAIGTVEAAQHIPDAFLSAIARVESGRADPTTGTVAAWPWTINAEGAGSFFNTKAEAVAAVRALQARGVRSIDVGCLQVNLLNHAGAFSSLEEAFDPAANASYAGSFLLSLFARTRSWPRAAAAYHSQTPTIGADYQRRVLAEWAVPNEDAGQAPPTRQRPHTAANAWPGDGGRAGSAASGGALASAASPTSPLASSPPAASRLAAATGSAIGHMAASFVHAAAPPGGVAFTGRSLAAYRMMPTALAFRLPPRPG